MPTIIHAGVIILFMVFSCAAAQDVPVLNTGPVEDFVARQNRDAEKFVAETRSADRQFRQKLRGMSQKDRQSAIEERRLAQFRGKEAFRRQQHDEAIAFLQLRMTSAEVSPADKQDLLNIFDAQFKDAALYGAPRREEAIHFFDANACDRSLTHARKRENLQAYFQQQKARALDERQQRERTRQAELQKKYSMMSASPTIQTR